MLENKKRIHMLDEIRGFAIICMIVHHSFLDIGDVLGLAWGYDIFDALCVVQPVFWAVFIIISGLCSRLSRNTVKRGAIVFAGALVITLFTAILLPLLGFTGAEIYFGILHCLGSCMIITGLLMPVIKRLDYKIGSFISLMLFMIFYNIDKGMLFFGIVSLPDKLYQYDFLAPIGFHSSNFFSADYFAIIPWIFLFLCGSFLGKPAVNENLPKIMYKKHSAFLSFIGKNSLWIYLAHQPILYTVFLIIAIFMR